MSQGYDSPSWWYDIRGFFILKLSYRGSLRQQIAFAERNLSDNHLEVAIGSGSLFGLILLFHRLKKKALGKVTGIDYAEKMLAGAKKKFGGKSNFTLRLEDIHQLSFTDDSFSSVNVINAAHCFSDLPVALRQIHRVLRPGGTLAVNILLYPSGSRFWKWIGNKINTWGTRKGILYTPYEKEDFKKKLLNAGFAIKEEELKGNSYSVLAQK